jgi:hypothetical protein
VTFGESTLPIAGRSPSAGSGHAKQHQPCGSSAAPKRCSSEEAIDDRLRMARCLLAGKAVAGIVDAVDREHREVVTTHRARRRAMGRAIARSFWGAAAVVKPDSRGTRTLRSHHNPASSLRSTATS